MKVKPKNTGYIIAATLLYTILVGIIGVLKLSHIMLSNLVNYLTNFILEGCYVAAIFYLMAILKQVDEKRTIILSLRIYIILDIIFFGWHLLVGRTGINGNILPMLIGFIATLYISAQATNVKDPVLSFPFKLLGAIMPLSLFFKLLISVFVIQHYVGRNLLYYVVLAETLPPLAIIYILYKALIITNNQQQVMPPTIANPDNSIENKLPK
ncbi:hypothetical protein [Mucilaginibacter dorajii]|uniref:Uncharacterized protein n=1 Tax=Mucilaginibacter dorajii TaxID=692994 RepID=A0ABP7QJT6_9SPHI|nr:hypothetical protein [Mucilaginibacter dorajii]MCS3734128.1 hypothetical protein [Mucilaginibacter dorajii]